MSNIALNSSATGTGTVTLASPVTNTNRTITLPDASGVTTVNSSGIPFLGVSQAVSTNTTLTAADNGKLLILTSPTIVTLPAVANGLAFGVINNASEEVVVKAASGSTLINGISGSVRFGVGSEAILCCNGTEWFALLGNPEVPVKIVTYTSSSTWNKPPLCTAILVGVYGATGGTLASTDTTKSGSGGGGYSETFFASPASSYSFTIGAAGSATGPTAGGTTTFGSMTVTGSAAATTNRNGGVGSGGTFNATGGAGGTGSTSGGGGGGGGGAGRSGNGGTAGNGGTSGGGGGGSGGNAASGSTGGAAATSTAVGTYSLSSFISQSFRAGTTVTGNIGGSGAAGTSNEEGFSPGRGTPGRGYTDGTGNAGTSGGVTIYEFYGVT